jgi:hypothetical protein
MYPGLSLSPTQDVWHLPGSSDGVTPEPPEASDSNLYHQPVPEAREIVQGMGMARVELYPRGGARGPSTIFCHDLPGSIEGGLPGAEYAPPSPPCAMRSDA